MESFGVVKMSKKTFEFGMDDVTAMAQFVAELTRQGLTYRVHQLAGGWRIELTGGY
jgi:hypothetical protein